MRKPTTLNTARRDPRRKRDRRRPDGRQAPGVRSRVLGRRTVGLAKPPSIVLELAIPSAVAASEIEVIERHLGSAIDDLLK
jgi:hypothetical protein